MAEYIERAALLDSICHETCRIAFCGATNCAFMAKVCSAPAADVAPVVRCKGCKHSWEDIGGLCCGYGPLVDSIVPEDFFCAYGKPKEGANADDHD